MPELPRRILSISFLTSLLLGVFPVLAAEVPPLKCSKLGQTTIYRNRKYTCIRKKISGKLQLAWDQGVPISKSQPINSPLPSSQPSAKIETPINNATPLEKIEIRVANSDELAEGKNLAVTVRNRYGQSTSYILFRNPMEIIAMSATCPHQGCNVVIDKTGLLCPCHNALFDNSNGGLLRGPAAYPLERVQVFEKFNVIYILD